MADSHDPLRQIDLLRQALSVPKRPIAFLIGAGCPLAIRDAQSNPLIPDIKHMTKAVSSDLAAGELAKPFEVIRKQLESIKDATIEDYLSHLRMLREVSQFSPVKDVTEDELGKLEASICAKVVSLAGPSLPNTGTPYHHLAAWIRGTSRAIPVELFTTNYDLLVEQALEELRVPYFDGFIGSFQAFFDPDAMESEESILPSRWARLWKLHGSINWKTVTRGAAVEVIRVGGKAKECHLIHPSHLKYDETRQMPFLAMMDRLKAFIRKPTSVLVTVGYSFSDRHINSLIRQALAGNHDAMAFGLLFNPLEEHKEAVTLAKTTPNLTLYAPDGALIGTRQLGWKAPLDTKVAATGVTAEETKTKVTLGDFSVLGQFLQELIGSHEEKEPAGVAGA